MGQRLTKTDVTQATRSLVVIHEGRDAPLWNEPTVVQEKPRLRVVFDVGQKIKSVEIDERVFERPKDFFDNHAYEAAGALVAAHYDEHEGSDNRRTITYALVATILALSWILPHASKVSTPDHRRAHTTVSEYSHPDTGTIQAPPDLTTTLTPMIDAFAARSAITAPVGHLTLHSLPSARVTITAANGRTWTAMTPINEMKLPAGSYKVSLQNDLLQMSASTEAQIGEGQFITRDVRLSLSQ